MVPCQRVIESTFVGVSLDPTRRAAARGSGWILMRVVDGSEPARYNTFVILGKIDMLVVVGVPELP